MSTTPVRIRIRIAVVGSPDFAQHTGIDATGKPHGWQIVMEWARDQANLPLNAVVVHSFDGGGPGVFVANAIRHTHFTIPCSYHNERQADSTLTILKAERKRDVAIVRDCDSLVAFWSPGKGKTEDYVTAWQIARVARENKPVRVILPDMSEMAPTEAVALAHEVFTRHADRWRADLANERPMPPVHQATADTGSLPLFGGVG